MQLLMSPKKRRSCFGNEHPWAILPYWRVKGPFLLSVHLSLLRPRMSMRPRNRPSPVLRDPLRLSSEDQQNKQSPKGLSLLGILPNQLRELLKSGGQDADIAFDDISMELFRHGYRIWIQRKRLNKNFWKNIAPNEWKKSYKEPGRTTRKKLEQKILSDKCRNPFHFLARHKNLSKIPPTPCRCFTNNTDKITIC